jgi:NitT/TauT family transport system permease protein
MKPAHGSLQRMLMQGLPVVATFAVVILLWQALVVLFGVSPFIVPAPTDVAHALAAGSPLYAQNLLATLYSTVVAFVLAISLGIVLGALVSEVRWIWRTLYPLLIAFQAMPRIALTPMIVVWFGFGYTSKIVVGVFSAFFPVFLNMVHGLQTAEPDQITLMRSFRASRAQIFWKIKFPHALPFLLAGANIAIIFAMLSVIVAEFLGSNVGMGFLIVNQSAQMDAAGVFANIIILSVVGLIFHYGLQYVGKRLLFWTETESGRVDA